MAGIDEEEAKKEEKERKVDLGKGIVVTVVPHSTPTFNADGSATVVTTFTITSITTTDPNTGVSSTTKVDNMPAPGLTTTTEVDRSADSQIIVDGKIAPRSWGDNIRDVAKAVAALKDHEGALFENGAESLGHLVDYLRSPEGQRLRYNALKGQVMADQAINTMIEKSLDGIKNGATGFFGPGGPVSEDTRRHNSCDGVSSTRFCQQ
jgi:hypothetical protein